MISKMSKTILNKKAKENGLRLIWIDNGFHLADQEHSYVYLCSLSFDADGFLFGGRGEYMPQGFSFPVFNIKEIDLVCDFIQSVADSLGSNQRIEGDSPFYLVRLRANYKRAFMIGLTSKPYGHEAFTVYDGRDYEWTVEAAPYTIEALSQEVNAMETIVLLAENAGLIKEIKK